MMLYCGSFNLQCTSPANGKAAPNVRNHSALYCGNPALTEPRGRSTTKRRVAIDMTAAPCAISFLSIAPGRGGMKEEEEDDDDEDDDDEGMVFLLSMMLRDVDGGEVDPVLDDAAPSPPFFCTSRDRPRLYFFQHCLSG
mmetsp:Transcript_23617/g.59498  ORF Transcript_23617/g.59498 Transcript_23617/m.59498 type:complete len:139 (+) Transcript_23617:257-673(+)